MSLTMLDNIKNHDASFIFTLTGDSDHSDETNEVYEKKDKYGLKYHDIHNVTNRWLKEHFPNITILNADSRYDCNYGDSNYFLAFDLDLSQIDMKTTVGSAITSLSNLDMSSYKTVFSILFPDATYYEPKIFAVPHIW